MPDTRSCCERGLCLMKHLIFDPGDEYGFVYTSNNTIPGSNVNFIALNVPREKAVDLGTCIMTCMSHHAVTPGIGHSHLAHGKGLYLVCKLVEGERKQALAQTHTTCTEPWTKLYELIPLFEYEDPKDWGSRPKFMDETKEDMVTDIITKWSMRVEFYLQNEALPLGRKVIDLAEALLHVDDWGVDWKYQLTKKEIDLVREHPEWFSKFAAMFFRKVRGCSSCKTLWEPGIKLQVCGGCKQLYYCGKDCQSKHWKKVHKKHCKLLRSRLDKDDPRSFVLNRTLGDEMW